MKTHQEVIVFSPEDFEQMLQLHQELSSAMDEEENQSNGEHRNSLVICLLWNVV